MDSDTKKIHRRRISKDEKPDDVQATLVAASDAPRPRLNGLNGQFISAPSSLSQTHPRSAGPLQTTFSPPHNQQPPPGRNGNPLPTSPLRTSFSIPSQTRTYPLGGGHHHSRSVSGPFAHTALAPPPTSPLSFAFPPHPDTRQHSLPASPSSSSSSSPELAGTSNATPPSPSTALQQKPQLPPPRRHSRIHSRNLSVFFPRPGSLPHASIAEDGSQELEYGGGGTAPVSVIPSAGESTHDGKLQAGFTFGRRPPSSAGDPPHKTPSSALRRGHHHKHSLSHNFFSFLEPGANLPAEGSPQSSSSSSGEVLHTQPAQTPMSAWHPISAFPRTAEHFRTSFAAPASSARTGDDKPEVRAGALGAAITQFFLGAWLWVMAQQVGSLACTGLGYWVVFDALGVALACVVPEFLARDRMQDRVRRPYGNSRVETVLMFTQSVYLVFASVYVCKETLEHLLLSVGEGHHHHRGDEDIFMLGIDFPVHLTGITLLTTLGTALLFENHCKLASITGNRIPPLRALVRSLRSKYAYSVRTHPAPSSRLQTVLHNPFVVAPVSFCLAILFVVACVPPSQHWASDLVIAAVETVVTFRVAYDASVALGTVLLQTAPARGLVGGRMEAFLRAMKEISRHPKVLHLPAPHIWQLTPAHGGRCTGQGLVVTLEVHVRRDLLDGEVLELTRWVWERCVRVLGEGPGGRDVEVTVGVVRG